MSELYDILVLGAGPSALQLAAETAERGLDVAILSPSPRAPWPANYCLWEDELPARFRPLIERRWEAARVATPDFEHALDRGYVKLDTARLQEAMWERLELTNIVVFDDYAENLQHDKAFSTIRTRSDRLHEARVVVDASGARTAFTKRVHQRPPAYQTAFGLLLEAPGHPFDPDVAVLMDFRPADMRDPDPPSFLYVLPLGRDRLFIEETVLAHRPAVGLDRLEGRLEARLRAYGLDRASRVEEEHCSIAMGLGLPVRNQRLVPFGAAASMVHPASGYLQARVLERSPHVADALAAGLTAGGGPEAAALANAAVWPREARVCWELYAVGLEMLVAMDGAETARFFGAFFQLPQKSWSDFLAGTLPPRSLTRVMTDLFRRLPPALRWRLVRSSATGGAAPLARSFMPMGVA